MDINPLSIATNLRGIVWMLAKGKTWGGGVGYATTTTTITERLSDFKQANKTKI